jgi:RNA polymerase sigma-70 factor (ECF subfamily)
MDMTPNEDAASLLAHLLAESRAGSLDGLGRLLEQFRPYLLQIAREELEPELQGKEGPSDIVQMSFMEAAHGFERFAGSDADDLRLWLRQILCNNINDLRDRYQTQKRQLERETRQRDLPSDHPARDIVDDASTPSERLVSQELLRALEESLAKLSTEQRELVRLRQKEGRSFVEIANLLGLSESAVQKRWARAVEELRSLMDVSRPGGLKGGQTKDQPQ